MDAESGPIIICSGIKIPPLDASHELRRRGFIVKHSTSTGNNTCFALSMSKRLIAKLATENNLPILAINDYTGFIQVTLANRAVNVIMRTTAIGAQACWVAADPNATEVQSKINQSKKDFSAALVAINDYYGPQIGLYFGFLDFYTNNLIPPMLAGCLLFLHQIVYNQLDSAWLPVFCLAITLWSTYFLEFWKRKCAELAYTWGVYGSEDRELTAELAKVQNNGNGNVYI